MRSIVFPGLVDLAAERLGGEPLLANDEFFASKSNLVKAGRSIFDADRYTERGKWMDGWETRRRRTPGYDWCIVRLGVEGTLRALDIDTDHFLGNHPPYASLQACRLPVGATVEEAARKAALWSELLPKSPLMPGSQNLFTVSSPEVYSHVRLNIIPDGGVARLRVYGKVVPDWSRYPDGLADLAALENGGCPVASSDAFFSSPQNLLLPGSPTNMGEGWESRRRRGAGHDWAVIKLGRSGRIRSVVVETTRFKGNYPDRCSIDVVNEPGPDIDALNCSDLPWKELLAESKLQADTLHRFEDEIREVGEVTHVRLNTFPDGGIARLRILGEF